MASPARGAVLSRNARPLGVSRPQNGVGARGRRDEGVSHMCLAGYPRYLNLYLLPELASGTGLIHLSFIHLQGNFSCNIQPTFRGSV